ncbi:hypothetical protein [Aeromicrobium sp.]|uniref:hypothetical protein n=1 Tax=Aeromicrobium sp. TaxID=1871063 RepID=UPI003515DF9E
MEPTDLRDRAASTDPEAARLVARRAALLREQGDDVAALADSLVARVDALGWEGRATAALRTRVAERARQLRRAAERHDAAADALARHARAVADAVDDIAARERRAATLLDQARERAEQGRPPHPADHRLLTIDLPPPGHPAWLGVELPASSEGS